MTLIGSHGLDGYNGVHGDHGVGQKNLEGRIRLESCLESHCLHFIRHKKEEVDV